MPLITPMNPIARSKTSLSLFAMLAILVAAAVLPLHAQNNAQSNALSDDEVIRRIDAAVHTRTSSISSYSVQELYSIFRNGEATPSAQVTVKTVYTRNAGKEYTPVAQSGSALLRNIIIGKILANEKEMARAANRESVALTSANYEMHPEAGTVTFSGHTCVIVDLKARRKISYLFNGRGWFDVNDFTLVHIEGSPAASPSFFAGSTGGHRDYIKIDGFSMAQRAELRSHSFLFGNTVLNIDYSDYQIQLSNTP
jgi:hypothetical protein